MWGWDLLGDWGIGGGLGETLAMAAIVSWGTDGGRGQGQREQEDGRGEHWLTEGGGQ